MNTKKIIIENKTNLSLSDITYMTLQVISEMEKEGTLQAVIFKHTNGKEYEVSLSANKKSDKYTVIQRFNPDKNKIS